MTMPADGTAPENPWRISEAEFPAAGSPAEQLRFLLRYAILAPSSHNTQPWIFVLNDDSVSLLADRSRQLEVVDPDGRELVISCGAALLNLRVALRAFGFTSDVSVLPDGGQPDLLAVVRLDSPRDADEDDRTLLTAMLHRHTNRQAFDDRPVPAEVLAALTAEAEAEGARLQLVHGDARTVVAGMVMDGDRRQFDDAAFRRELSSWMRTGITAQRDGLHAHALGLSDVESLAAPLLIRTFDVGNRQAARDEALLVHTPVLAVLGTDGDAPADRLAAGQALERVLLRATATGLSASLLNQPIEIPQMRPQLHEVVGGALYPQLLMRLGYGPPAAVEPRRPLDEVVVDRHAAGG